MKIQWVAIESLTILDLRFLSESLVLHRGFQHQPISVAWEVVRHAGSQAPPQESVFAGDSDACSRRDSLACDTATE